MEEGIHVDLCEALWDLADEIHEYPSRDHIALKLQELAGADTRDVFIPKQGER